MKNTLLFSTLVIGLALTGCTKETRTTSATDTTTTPSSTDTTARTSTPTTGDTAGAKIDRAADRMAEATRQAGRDMQQAGRDISARMSEWRLSASDIEADVRANREVVRTKSTAGAPTGAINEDTLESAIKGKLNADSQLAGLKFDVNANKKGEVELEGKARTADQIARAIATALDTDGVAKVTSKIKLDPDAGSVR